MSDAQYAFAYHRFVFSAYPWLAAYGRRGFAALWTPLVSRGNLKPVGIYLFWLINNYLINLLGIPVGTLRGLDSDGRSSLNPASSCRWDQTYKTKGRENVSHG